MHMIFIIIRLYYLFHIFRLRKTYLTVPISIKIAKAIRPEILILEWNHVVKLKIRVSIFLSHECGAFQYIFLIINELCGLRSRAESHSESRTESLGNRDSIIKYPWLKTSSIRSSQSNALTAIGDFSYYWTIILAITNFQITSQGLAIVAMNRDSLDVITRYKKTKTRTDIVKRQIKSGRTAQGDEQIICESTWSTLLD